MLLSSARCLNVRAERVLRPSRTSALLSRPAVRQPHVRNKALVCVALRQREVIIGLAEQYCNDFICTSSPSVEPTVRTLANDVENCVDGRRTERVYSAEVTYKDPLRSFTGRDKYQRMKHIAETVTDPKAFITGLELKSLETVVMTYRLEGNTPGGKLDMDFTETYKVNQITGRVMQHEVAWSFGRTGAPAAAYFTATRTAYSTKQAAVDLSEAAETLLAAEENPNKDFQGDPNDPMKFFQQEDTSMNDMLTFAFFATALYAVVQVLIVLKV